MRVHIVEDDYGVCDSLDHLLRGMGHETCTYASAESFFDRMPPAPEDVVIVDLLLPGMSGALVAHWLGRLRDPPHVVVVSGQPQSVIDAQVKGLDVPPVVRKPLNEDIVAAQLPARRDRPEAEVDDEGLH